MWERGVSGPLDAAPVGGTMWALEQEEKCSGGYNRLLLLAGAGSERWPGASSEQCRRLVVV